VPVQVGSTAPRFRLPLLGGGEFALSASLSAGPIVLAFFKTTCPTCMLAFPFLERIHVRSNALRLLAISQDSAQATARFHEEFEIAMPTALDSADGSYAVSNAYAITHVPSLFLISAEGSIEWFSTGFSKPELEELGSIAQAEVFAPGDRVPVWKPG